MRLTAFLRRTLLALSLLAWTLPVLSAGNCPHGEVLYYAPVRGIACANSTCHGTNLSKNLNWILWGANAPENLAQAIKNGGGGMTVFQGVFSQSDLEDLAAYIGSWQACPAGGPDVAISPTSNTFATQDVGTMSTPFSVTVSNTGLLPATGLAISNSNDDEFPTTNDCATTLSSGASCTITVAFKPTASGIRSTTLTIDSSAGPKVVGLYGMGRVDTPNTMDVIEFYYADFNAYFITALPLEIQKLDDGTFPGWKRTSLQFKAQPLGTPGGLTVCRFFSIAFGARSAHFYTPVQSECESLKSNDDWIFEAQVFAMAGANPDGTCRAGTTPVYRLYNNGEGGAPNHRYTTLDTIRDAMITAGWILEGNGPGLAFMCAPQ